MSENEVEKLMCCDYSVLLVAFTEEGLPTELLGGPSELVTLLRYPGGGQAGRP